MVIKVFVSSTSGNKEMKKKQEFIHQLLEVKNIEFEEVDITSPKLGDEKAWMQKNAVPKEGQVNPLPPQIFNDETYCGDYDQLHEANESDELMDFLKLSSESSPAAGQDGDEQ